MSPRRPWWRPTFTEDVRPSPSDQPARIPVFNERVCPDCGGQRVVNDRLGKGVVPCPRCGDTPQDARR